MNPASHLHLPSRVHIIGICGVATSALAIALSERKVAVTGSDKGFFPPVSTELSRRKIAFYAGWHPEKMIAYGLPEIVVAGGSGTSPSNPEVLFAKARGLPVLSFAEAIGSFVVKKNSIVTAGTWGKTTNSALLSSILAAAGMKPSYFTGGVPLSHKSGVIADSDWSVVEGDEYQAAIWDKKAKFFYYHPVYLLLSAVSWDHADLYPSEAEYFRAFLKLLEMIPANGFVTACADNDGVGTAMRSWKGKAVWYGREGNKLASYTYDRVKQTKDGLDFRLQHESKAWEIHSPMLGLYQSENIAGCFALARELGIAAEKILTAISRFKGIRRRLEKRHEGPVAIYDDIAHSPDKAGPVLQTLRSIYGGKVIAVFEPNIGGRQRQTAHKYDHAFASADIVVIPELSKLKTAADQSEQPMNGAEVAVAIGKTHGAVHYIGDDSALVRFLVETAEPGDVIAFLGSRGWRGMIERTIAKISS
ncbi:MAG: UDP-N-acetylmuramate: L-alanyl-gamma-D-glutamyl-meso-diaminopimelate ligase [Candidatus Parcubacteria bacterium]|jgi:UDP-N-acetylmuramate: L-alanyl-gamma-D-glutamyl-meso-diaminopimelate ligase|nr:UDP-N-acetylmuramate: L-alanyl-gamma-D-glutamyl-meso-diaminopimelate ligase [Candidatus Parcubacteria bacterium]